MHRALLAAATAAALLLTACGDDASEPTASVEAPAASAVDLGPIKDFLLDHTARLEREVGGLARDAAALHALAEAHDFDHARMLRAERAEVRDLVGRLQDGFRRANPAYEEMEGVVAGVPELADFDVSIDAGGDASDPENAVPFTVRTPAGKELEQPGNFNYLVETAVFGTEPRFAAKGVRPDLDDDGEVEFGEALPDADVLLAVTRDFAAETRELDEAARAWDPTPQDAFTALVVMTPTMSEYFGAWKSSRFIAGEASKEKAFVAASRLQDIADILGGLVLVFDGVRPAIASVDPARAEQTGRDLRALERFAVRLRDEEAGGKKFTARDADTLGSEAQRRAEAIAGQVSQAAGRLGVPLES